MKTGILRRWSPAAMGRRDDVCRVKRPSRLRGLVALVVVGCGALSVPPLHAGPEILLYPLARAFGSPSETELAHCREAFRKIKDGMAENPVLVAPVLVQPLRAKPAAPDWRGELARELADRMSAERNVRMTATTDTPAIATPEMGRNQLRYAWHRAAEYADASKKAAPRTQPVLFTEVWTDRGHVAAIHFFVIDPAGQIAFCRWFNSHQFGQQLSFENGAWLDFAVRRLQRDLARTPEELFPPYGIG